MPRKMLPPGAPPRSHPWLPRLWLMTDERLDPELLATIAGLPAGSGVVFRHYRTPAHKRAALLARVAAIARRRRLVLVVALPPHGARIRAEHLPSRALKAPRQRRRLVTAAVHTPREMAQARRAGARLLFVSPVRATQSHPGVRPLGHAGFARLARLSLLPVVALGGVGPADLHLLEPLGAHGVAGISAFAGCKGRKGPAQREPGPG